MSQNLEKYLYFNVGLLKSSFALNALWQDALKYHMIDQPDKLIALRLTEYYEMMAQGSVPSGSSVSKPIEGGNGRNRGGAATAGSTGIDEESSTTGQADDHYPDDEGFITASPDAEQNADEAAEYWASL